MLIDDQNMIYKHTAAEVKKKIENRYDFIKQYSKTVCVTVNKLLL